MKRLVPLLAILLGGCFFNADSPNPFYTEATRVRLPELVGEWDSFSYQRSLAERRTESTCVFSGGEPLRLRCYTDNGYDDSTVVPFRVGDVIFCDVSGGRRGYHNVYRVQLQGRELRLEGLNGEWLTNAIAAGTLPLPPPQRDAASNLVFDVSSEQWIGFLAQHGTNSDAFGSGVSLTRVRSNFTPLRRP